MGSLLQTILKISKSPSPGPAPGFSHIDICRALLIIGDKGPIGRIELSRALALGEGTTRTIVRHLTQARSVSTVKDGCVLTSRGSKIYKPLRAKLSNVFMIDARQLALDKVNATILVRAAGRNVRHGIEQRDAAIRANATGACTLIVGADTYRMPMGEKNDWTLGSKDPLSQELNRTLTPEDDDVVIIVSGPTSERAGQGAMAAALTLLK